MWEKFSVLIIRNRIVLIVLLALISVFMGYKASFVELTYDNPKFIPDNDEEYQLYQDFKKTFGDDGKVLVIGIETEKLLDPAFFNDWCALSDSIEKKPGIEQILSMANVPTFVLTTEQSILGEDTFTVDAFAQRQIINGPISSKEELDSLLGAIRNLTFYDGILFTKESNFTLMAVTLKREILDSKKRIAFVTNLVDQVNDVCKKHQVEAHFSGLPYIRTKFSNRVQDELKMFTLLSFIITALILLFFFRSIYTLVFSMLVVAVGVVWSFGILVLLGYKITMFIGLLPPLIVVIGIANCIYLLNKYHDEYRTHGNQILALQRVIHRVGIAVFFTNLTTAIGFGVFVLTGSTVLKEFGLTAFLSVMSVFVISIILIPVIFSFLPQPSSNQTKHLDSKFLQKLMNRLSLIVTKKRKAVYIVTITVVVAMIYGMTRINAIGFMVDDIAETDVIYKDLKFFERNVKGVLPLEIIIDTRKDGGIQDPVILRKIDYFERQKLSTNPILSRSVSVAQVINFARQELHDGNPNYYRTPNNLELGRILDLLANHKSKDGNTKKISESMLDSSRSKARISVQMADVGTKEIKRLKEEIRLMADTIFNHSREDNSEQTDSILNIAVNEYDSTTFDTTYHSVVTTTYTPVDSADRIDIVMTGTSIIFQKGNDYLNYNLLISLLVAFLVIGSIMATIFISFRMIVISLIPNIIPLLITAGCMGYFNVALKPSTVLVFSVAFGIAVDFTIHFLSKYRMELRRNKYNIQKAVSKALSETGVSMVYTSVILFFGFIIFAGSSFGGTIALGIFTSLTLVFALLSNLVLLPSLLLSYDQAKERAKSKKSPLIVYPDEEA
ncbi:MAG: putative RND superfamily exporter protein [Bacteroidia bacterium]|jgi:predicted RND superfamily exporter protein